MSAVVFFSKLFVSKNYFRNIIRVSNSLDPDQDQHFLARICIQLFAKVISRRKKVLLARKELKYLFDFMVVTCAIREALL